MCTLRLTLIKQVISQMMLRTLQNQNKKDLNDRKEPVTRSKLKE